MTDKATELFEASWQYAKTFIQLNLDLDCHTQFDRVNSDAALVNALKQEEEYKIHYLFPNCSDEVRSSLFKLACCRMGIKLSRNSKEFGPHKNQMEKKFVDLSRLILPILDDLLPLQSEILQEKYLSNPLAE